MEYIQLIVGLIILVASGEALVRGSVGIAVKLRVSTLVIGMTVVSFGTSAPELLVAIKAALKDKPDITIGAVLGSNVSNIALIMGLTALVFPMKVQRDSIFIDWPVMMISTLLFYFLILNGVLGRIEGMVLVATLITFTLWLIIRSRKLNKHDEKYDTEAEISESFVDYGKDILFMVLGFLGLVIGADLFVDGADDIALHLGISPRAIGLSVVALGTSLPELITSLVAAFRRQMDISVGNLIGSNIFNILSILGITSIIKEINVNEYFISFDVYWLLGISFIILPMMLNRRQISRFEGLILLTGYVMFIHFVFSKT